MKYFNRLVQIILIGLIATSFYLSYLIWLFPANQETTDVQEVSQEVADLRSNQELFLPTQFIWRNNQSTFTSHSESLIRNIHDQFKKIKLKKMTTITYANQNELAKIYDGTDFLIWHYLSEMDLQSYLQTYHLQLSDESIKKVQHATFDTIQVQLNKKRILFIQTSKNKVIQYKIASLPNKNLQSLLTKEKNKMQVYTTDQTIVNGEILSAQPLQLKLYSYISADQPYTVFRDAFFEDTKNIKVNDDTPDAIAISDNQGDILTVNLNSQMIDYRENNYPMKNKNLYMVSAQYMANLGTSMGQLRYFTSDDQRFVYRPFVEGYPIFRQDNQDAIEITFSPTVDKGQKNIKIVGNLTTIQVPIPSDKTQELPGALTVYQQLFNAGLSNESYPMLTIGYQWTDLQDTGVVDLTPTWFVYYQGQWYQYQILVKKIQSGNDSIN